MIERAPDTARRDLLKTAVAAIGSLALPPVLAGDSGAPEFRRGVNLSFWLQLSTEEPLKDEDLRAVAAAGFDHVRLPVDPLTIGWQAQSGHADTFSHIDRLDSALESIFNAGLNCILDFHPDEPSIAVLKAPGGESAWLEAWGSLARRYAPHPPSRLALELLNEPQRIYGADSKAWTRAQQLAVARIRRATDRHWLMTVGLYDPVNTLRRLEPPQDPRLIATTHCYWPYEITHMGATWDDAVSSGRRDVRNLRYPAALTDIRVPHVAAGTHDLQSEKLAADYVSAGWDIEKIRPHIKAAADWSREHGIAVHYTEFGILRSYVDPDSRIRWLHDVRSLIEQYGMGWTVYDLSCNFGIIALDGVGPSHWQKQCPVHPGTVHIEPRVSQALGLPSETEPRREFGSQDSAVLQGSALSPACPTGCTPGTSGSLQPVSAALS